MSTHCQRRLSLPLILISVLILLSALTRQVRPTNDVVDSRRQSDSTNNNDKSGGSPAPDQAAASSRDVSGDSSAAAAIIPVAGSNFEAAFQGECGESNGANPAATDKGRRRQASNPCEHICLDLHDGTYECACFYGFLLAVDGYSCSPASSAVAIAAASNATATTTTATSTATAPPGQMSNGAAQENLGATDRVSNDQGGKSRAGPEAIVQRRRPGNNRNSIVDKASAGDKWPSYHIDPQPGERKAPASAQPETNNKGAAQGRKRANSNRNWNDKSDTAASQDADRELDGETIEFGGADGPDLFAEDPYEDPDIKSIMKSNDRLVKQLARSVLAVATERPEFEMENYDNAVVGGGGGGSGDDSMEMTDDNWKSDNSYSATGARGARSAPAGPQKERQKLAAAYEQLEQLVQETIVVDYTRDMEENSNSSRERNAPEHAPHAGRSIGGDGAKEQSISSIKGEDRSWARDQAQRRRRIFRNDGQQNATKIGPKLGIMESANSLCYENESGDEDGTRAGQDKPPACGQPDSEAAGCEAGGRCSAETVWVSSRDTDVAWLRRRSRCRCPIGRGGRRCQKPLQRRVPRFLGRSYLALPMLSERSLSSLRLVFKPETRRFKFADVDEELDEVGQSQGDARYIGRQSSHYETTKAVSEQQTILLYSNRFLLLLDEFGRVELRYLSGARHHNRHSSRHHRDHHDHHDHHEVGGGGEGEINGRDRVEAYATSPQSAAYNEQMAPATRVIGSQDVVQNEWNELVVTDALSDSTNAARENTGEDSVKVNRKILLVTPDKIPLGDSRTVQEQAELFVAGLPRGGQDRTDSMGADDNSILDVSSLSGFTGCIKSLSINGRVYNFKSDLNGDALDGFDVVECCES